jgi:hypothetical protein
MISESTTVRSLSVLCLVALLISAGCSAGTFTGPSGQKGPVGLNVTNAANDTHTFEVFVVELPANVTVQLPDGRKQSDDIDPGLVSTGPGVYQAYTAVEPPNSARLHGRYTLNPNETNISNISSLPENFAVIVTIHENDDVVSWVSATCDGDLVYLGVTMRYYGSDNVYNCN